MNSELDLNSTKVKELKGLRITYEDIHPLILELDKSIYKDEIVGYSENNVPIHLIKFGSGDIKIIMWTQMHGDESTATKSVFDLFNIVNSYKFTNVINKIISSCTIYVLPMLNPDGAKKYTRENHHGLDLNRDAKTLINNESKLLLKLITEIKPDFAFNLHDQTSYYNVQGSDKVATISLLAPALDDSNTINNSRKLAMSVIASMNQILQEYIPHHVGRYNDTFCFDCFGDSIQSLGIPTILVESGYFPGDENREETRKLHTIALIRALEVISTNDFLSFEDYFKIPVNEKRFYDKKIENVLYKGKLTCVGVRYKYIFYHNKLLKIIDETETIEGIQLENMLFHEVIDAKGIDFNKYC